MIIKILFTAVIIFFHTASNVVGSNKSRALFMSTAGSVISTEETKRAETEIKRERPSPLDKQSSYELNTYLGMKVQVMKYDPKSGNYYLVQPDKHIFREGDKFKVKVFFNSPGVVSFINIDPKKNTNYLGDWYVDTPFHGVMLPSDGWFMFTGEKGIDLLVIDFTPCKVNDAQIIQRDDSSIIRTKNITLVRDKNLEKQLSNREIKKELAELPFCTNVRRKELYPDYKNWVALGKNKPASRGILYIRDKKDGDYYFREFREYLKTNDPISIVLSFMYY